MISFLRFANPRSKVKQTTGTVSYFFLSSCSFCFCFSSLYSSTYSSFNSSSSSMFSMMSSMSSIISSHKSASLSSFTSCFSSLAKPVKLFAFSANSNAVLTFMMMLASPITTANSPSLSLMFCSILLFYLIVNDLFLLQCNYTQILFN